MKTLVTYQSKTGFTKKYAEWIAQEMAAELKESGKISGAEAAEYDLVLHGGWIMGGMVNGLEKIRSCHPKHLIVFGVGFTPRAEADVQKMAEANKLGGVPFFYCEGGMNPDGMGFLGRLMVKMVTKKPLKYADHTDKDQIRAIVEAAREMQL